MHEPVHEKAVELLLSPMSRSGDGLVHSFMFGKSGSHPRTWRMNVDIIKGLPTHLFVRDMGYTSVALAELKRVSIAFANIMLAKVYMDSVRKRNSQTDPHMLDAALLAAVVKYASVFKTDSRGNSIDASKIYTPKVLIINKSVSAEPLLIDDPNLNLLKNTRAHIKDTRPVRCT
jgi:hypothetical protein